MFNKTAEAWQAHCQVSLTRPSKALLGNHRSLPGQQKVKTSAFIVGLGQEYDGDYHLILTSLDGQDSLIAEVPDPGCKQIKAFPGLKQDRKR